MLKIGFISDCHLGYKTGRIRTREQINLREEDGYQAFKECIEGFIEHNVDFVIIAGDLFHSPKPEITTIVRAKREIDKLSEKGIECYIITGNHDTSDITHDYSSVLLVDSPLVGVHAMDKPLEVVNKGEKLKLWFVSHQSHKTQEETFSKITLSDENMNILVTHGSCYDDFIGSVLHTELEPREIVIPEKILNLEWDYVLMGHIHTRGWVHSKDRLTDTEGRKQFYGGSLIRRGFSDSESPLGRGYTILTVDEEKRDIKLSLHTISQRPQFEINISCKDKKSDDIEQETIREISKIKTQDIPIVRVVFWGMNKSQKNNIDWKSIKRLSDAFLTFNLSYKNEENIEYIHTTSYNLEANDILSDYKEFWKEEQKEIEEHLREGTGKVSEEYIKIGINNIIQK